MKRFIEGECRAQSTLLPERLDDGIAEDNPVRAVDAFVDELDLAKLGFEGAEPAATGRPAYHPATLLKIYIYGYLNRRTSTYFPSRSESPGVTRSIALLTCCHASRAASFALAHDNCEPPLARSHSRSSSGSDCSNE